MRKNISESYTKLPRTNSTHSRQTYDTLAELAGLIDFNHPKLKHRAMRNHSLGSVQTVLVEMALQNDDILNKLRQYMVLDGKDWKPIIYYRDKY